MKMYNEKPSKLTNLGVDVAGAHRHHHDTYNNPEARAAREKVKATKNNRKALKDSAILALSSDTLTVDEFRGILCAYEMALALDKFSAYDGPSDGSIDALKALKAHVLALRPVPWNKEQSVIYSDACKAFNRLSRACSKIRYYIGTLDKARAYLAPKTKESFKEFNGVEKPWALSDGQKMESSTIERLKNLTRAVQFGNSLTLIEREYCLKNLEDSIELLNKHFTFNFKDLAFSFGARGKAGSIAHYQDSQKVLAFNRGWSGAFVHELGHAVDYALGRASYRIPLEIRSRYYKKISALKLDRTAREYYNNDKEIFARLFEVYLRDLIPGMSEFMQVTFDASVMPDLDEESRAWMSDALKSLVVGV